MVFVVNIKKLIERKSFEKENKILNFTSEKPVEIDAFKKIILSLNKKIQFEESSIPKFYRISSNKIKKHNLKFRSTLSAIKSTIINR